MRALFRSTIITAIALYVTTFIAPGLVISGNLVMYLGAAFVFVLTVSVMRPILSLFAFPFAFLSGLIVMIVANGVALYITALILKSVKVLPFHVQTGSVLGFEGVSFYAGNILSYITISVIIALIVKLLEWMFDMG